MQLDPEELSHLADEDFIHDEARFDLEDRLSREDYDSDHYKPYHPYGFRREETR